MPALTIVDNRLLADLSALGSIGADGDKGIFRSAFSDAEMQAREWFRRRVEAAGLEFHVDGAANMYARLNWQEGAPSVMMGSHLDTVPGGGHLDGALGVLAGLEVVRCLKTQNVALKHPVEVVAFTDEEGAFGGMVGSQAVSGQLTAVQIDAMTSRDRGSLKTAMQQRGFDPARISSARRSPESLKAYIELHIEQGPVLERLGFRLGAVEGIAGQLKWLVTLRGEANHAGTTPMSLRHDAFAGLAEMAMKVEKTLEEVGGDNSVATIGYVDVKPGASNVIPNQATFTLDVRDADNGVLEALGAAFRGLILKVADRRGLESNIDELIGIPGVACDETIVPVIERAAALFGVAAHRMPSGAVHDAQMMASVTRAGMIFIPSIDGLSHAALERSDTDDIVLGANVLLNVVADLAAG